MSEASSSPWNEAVGVATRSETIHLVDGTTFVVSSPSGTIDGESSHGLFLLDTRVLSRWRLEIEGWSLEPLHSVTDEPFAATFVTRAHRTREPDSPLAIVERRFVGGGMHHDIEIRNHGPALQLRLRLAVAADLAGLFDVKLGATAGRPVDTERTPDGLAFRHGTAEPGLIEAVEVAATRPPDAFDLPGGSIAWDVAIGDGDTWSTCIQVSAIARGGALRPTHGCGISTDEAVPVRRLRRWREKTPTFVSADAALNKTITTALDDLGALRIFDPDHADRVVVAAGAPWFMALFGRDSLLTSWMTLPFDVELAYGVLAELADHQGVEHNPRSDEQPGRILHEVRFDPLSHEMLGGSTIYYGSVDATPLFVMLVAELARWTGVTDRIRALLPAVDRAIEWIERWGDRDGDEFVEYLRGVDSGLGHQGWKDSWDGIRHDDGSVAVPPIALCEVQGYVYAAYRGRADLARALGDAGAGASYDQKAADLRQRFDEAFWLDERGWYAVGLDEAKRPIRSLTSNIGHLLWCGIVPEHRAARLVEHLTSPAMNSGWGVRTLAADSAGYNPLSYHCGSVWPHDTAITAAGLARYGFDDEAHALTRALLDAGAAIGGSLPELFGGFARDDVGAPVPYPTSCSPQAWASAAPLLLLRALLGLEPDVPGGRLRLRPRLPDWVGALSLRGVAVGTDRVDIAVGGGDARVSGSGLHIEIS